MTFGMTMIGVSNGGTTIMLAASYSPSALVAAGTATATFELTNGGDIRVSSGNGTISDVGDWITPKFGFSGFEARLTVNSGTTPSGAATGSFLSLGTTRTWTIARAVLGIESSGCTLQIRDATTLTVLASSTITFSAERT